MEQSHIVKLEQTLFQNRPFHVEDLDPKAILTSIGEVVYDWDMSSDAISWGLNVRDVLKITDKNLINSGRAFALVTEPESGRTRHDAINSSHAKDEGSGVAYHTRYILRLATDHLLDVEDTGRWFANLDGEPSFAHGVLRVSPLDAKTMNERRHMDVRPRDRSAFLVRLSDDIHDALKARRSMTLLIISIDGLAGMNDRLGYDSVDGVIEQVMRRLQGVMRRRDRLVRYGGNRFAVVLSSCPLAQAEQAAKRFSDMIESNPIETGGSLEKINLKIGAACVPDFASEATGLLRRAEEALVSAENHASKAFALFDTSMMYVQKRQASTSVDIVEALNTRHVLCALQPIVDAHSREPAFYEALVRVRHEKGHLILAGDIIPAIERSGLINLVDNRMFELVSDCLWQNPEQRISINVSPVTLEESDWLTNFAAHLGAHPGIASRLIVEVTESAAIQNVAAMRSKLDAMKALGVAIAVDDFGAGHTSFKHLRNFPIDILKIDGAFIQNLPRSVDDRFFVRTLVDLAHHLGIATVGEWVEDEETARMLANWGVDYLQGDHCGKPEVMPETTNGCLLNEAPKMQVA